MQRLELATCHLAFDFGVRLAGRVEELRREDVADRIGLEGAAEAARVPVHILQAAVAVVGRTDTEIGLVAGMPRFRQILHRQLPFEQFAFEIEADHHMQIVGHLVGVGADQRALDLVDGAIERVELHALQLFWKSGL